MKNIRPVKVVFDWFGRTIRKDAGFRNLPWLLLMVCSHFAFASNANAQSAPLLSLQRVPPKVSISVSGDVGSPCQIQFATNLNAPQWTILTNLTLSTNSIQVTDTFASVGQRYYRGVVLVPANLIWVAAGSFTMGSPTNEVERNTNEVQHRVTFSRGVFIGRYQVTQSNYLAVTGVNPSYYTPSNGYSADLGRPVEQVSWFDATNYCFLLTQQDQLAGRIATNWFYRLPTESEWEFACRAGTTNPFYLGSNLVSGAANFDGEYEYYSGTGTVFNAAGIFLNRTVDVGGYQPNALGLYDMAGNVWEWCQDWFGNYPTNSVTDPTGATNGTSRVFRGGSLNATGRLCRSANRNDANPSTVVDTIGFRVVLSQ